MFAFPVHGKVLFIENRLMVAKRAMVAGGGKEWEFGISRGKLAYTGW